MKRMSILFVLGLMGLMSVSWAQPSIEVFSVENISATKAKFRGNIQNLGSKMAEIRKRGFIIAPVNNYSAGDTIKYEETANKKNEMYTYEITNMSQYLRPGTDYWVQAYMNFKKTGSDTEWVYSEKYEFTTASPINDYSTVNYVDNASLTTATLKGTIDSAGNADILFDCGFVYSTQPNPTINSENSEYTRSTFNDNNIYPKSISSDIIELEASTTYYYRIWTINKYTNTYYDTAYSAQKSFTTQHACGAIPKKLDTVYVHTDEVELKWEAQEGQTKFEVEYGFSGHTIGEGDTVIVEGTHVVLDSLESNRSYTSYVRAICPDKNSEWSDMRPFHTQAALCEKVMGLHLDNATTITAKVSWTAGKTGDNRWEVLFARNDDSYPSQPFTVYDKPIYFPVGLTLNTEYKLKVRTVCTITYDTTEIIMLDDGTFDTIETTADSLTYGLWSNDLVFTTAPSSLEEGFEIDYCVSVFPNPAEDVIYFKGKPQNIDKIEIYSAMGTLVYQSSVLPEQLSTKAIGSGTFIIHIYTQKGVQTEKIIVK